MLKCKDGIKHHLLVIIREQAEDGRKALIRKCTIWNADLPENVGSPSAFFRIT